MLFNKGIIQYGINDYFGAELSLSKAYYIFKDSEEKDKLYGTLNQLGLVYNELKEYDRSAEYHNRALKTVREFKLQSSEHQEAVCYNNLGYLYIKQKKFKQASINFELGLRDKTIINDDPELYSSLIDNYAFCKMKINDNTELPKLFFDALNIRKRLDNNTVIVGSYIHLSEYYYKKGDLFSALKYSNEALKIARASKSPVNIILALKQASIVDKKNAVKYSENYIRISDSLQVIERNSKDRFSRLQLETEEIKKENVFLEAKNRDILNYFMGTMAIAGLLFFMRAQRAKSRELILKQAQQKANEDIYKLIISQQGKIDEGRIMEKTRIAKELHDGVLGRMFGLRLNLDGLNHRTDDEAVAERIRCLEELKIIEQDLREISHELSREKYVLINNFVAIVNNLLEEQTKINTAVLSATIGEDIDWELLSNTTKINLYRILQESLQNINKYAQAKTIKVDLRKDKKGNLVLNIVDDGVGFETDKNSKGIGLKNIVTRTHESEGIIDIKSSKNKGTQIKVTVPLENKSIKI
jgi:signal transduction histidine kinase